MISLVSYVTDILSSAFRNLNIDGPIQCSLSTFPDVDFQCNDALRYARSAGVSSVDLANAVAEIVRQDQSFESVDVGGRGFINLRLSTTVMSYMLDAVLEPIQRGNHKQTVVLDYGGPNVAKPLHVGHLRSLVIGECLRRVFFTCGYAVTSDAHFGDWGLQMGMLISEIEIRYPNWRTDWADYLAGLRGPWAITAEDLITIYPAAAAACQASPERMEAARQATALLQSEDPSYMELWNLIKRTSYSSMAEDFGKLEILFSVLNGESDVRNHIQPMLADLTAKGLLTTSEGAVVLDVSEPSGTKTIPPLMLVKSDGAHLYGTTDLATIVQRTRQLSVIKIIYVVDSRQKLHFEQVFRAARKAGYANNVELIHAEFGTVNGADGKPFKTRAGGVARLADLLDEAVHKAAQRVPAGVDQSAVARAVGLGAIKFADLITDRRSGYVYDVDQMLSFEGKTGPYVQYAGVRLRSILERARAENIEFVQNISMSNPYGRPSYSVIIGSPYERALVLLCLLQRDRFEQVVLTCSPHVLAEYTFELAQAFSKFYANCPVLGEPDEAVRGSRLALCYVVFEILARALWCLGITIPTRM